MLVQFFVDTNGILNVKATNKATGYTKKIRITHSKGRFTEDQMEKMARRAEKYAARDKKEREKVEKLLELKKYIRDIKKQLKTKVLVGCVYIYTYLSELNLDPPTPYSLIPILPNPQDRR